MIGYSRPDISSPTQRGHMVRSRLLCQDVPPPPANLDTMFKPAATAQTTRQHFETEHTVGVCYACHKLMDDIGYGFEHYDGFGRYRTTENGGTIDASGTLVNLTHGRQPPFNGLTGAGSLGAYLAAERRREPAWSATGRTWPTAPAAGRRTPARTPRSAARRAPPATASRAR